jgi:hypothetical protein
MTRIRARLKWNIEARGNRRRFYRFVWEASLSGWTLTDFGPERSDPQTYSHWILFERTTDARL